VTDLGWQPALLVAIEPRTARVKSYFVEPLRPFSFRAGQHVDVRLTAPDGYQAERSYSIASAPEAAGPFELVIELLDDGEVSPYFHEIAEVGDEIEIRGPFGGHFVWSVGDGGPLLLVGGGSGIVPLMSMLRHRALGAAETRTLVLVAAKSADAVIFRQELLALERTPNGPSVVLALSRERAERADDYSRRVDRDMMTELCGRLVDPPRHVFVCGSNPFVEAVTKSLAEAGVPADVVRTERTVVDRTATVVSAVSRQLAALLAFGSACAAV
jgi:ferredoxin-NADP reductase